MSGAEALEKALDKQRRVIRKRWNVVASDAGMTYQHMRKILTGKVQLTEFAASGFDGAVGWPDGHAWSVYRDAEPTPERVEADRRDRARRTIEGMDYLPDDTRQALLEALEPEPHRPPSAPAALRREAG